MYIETVIKIKRKQDRDLYQSWREVFVRISHFWTPTARRRCNLAFLILFLSLPFLLTPANSGAATASITLSAPVISEGDDFSTRVLGLPWDMNTQPYPDFATVFFGVDRASFAANGSTWSFTTTNNDPSLQLLYPGIKGCQEVLRLGDRFPIDTGKYNLLSFRLCSSAGSTANVHWFYDQFPATVFASSNFIPISATTGSDCRVYVVDMNQIGVAEAFGGAAGWNGLIKGLRLDPVNTGSGLSLQMDWVRLTTTDTSRIVPINWANVGSGTNLFFYLSKGSTCSTGGATLIGTARRTGSSGTFNWGSSLQPNPTPATPFPLPESFQPGQYSVFMLVDNTGPAVCAASTLDIRKAPQLSFQKPSFFSGPDYATELFGYPWSMDSPADVMSTNNLTSYDFTGGIFNGLTNSSGDSSYYLHVTTPIDTKRYKYLTFRYLLDGTQDIGMGWVHRFVWWWKGVGIDHTVTKDMIIYENWQTYSVDLSKALIEESSLGPGWTGAPSAFRMNPSEMPIPMTFHTDFVTLTGDEQVQTGVPFPIYYQTTPGSGLTVSLFYDTDVISTNGRSPIGISTSPCPPPPSPQLNLLTGTCVMWDTSGVLKGSYFISADVSDGVSTTTWYSETPVSVNFGPPSGSIIGLNISDLNGDGKADILWRQTSSPMSTWFMNGTGITGIGSLPSVSTDWTIVGSGDFNGDGKADILWRHTSGDLVTWLMNGASIVQVAFLPNVSTKWTIKGLGDLNGDGKADILWRHTSGDLVTWLMNGTSILQVAFLPNVSTDWTIIGLGDFSGEGKADILWRHTSGDLVTWLMDGVSIVQVAFLPNVSTKWTIKGLGDFNGDGKADILWRHASGSVYEWLMDGINIIQVAPLPSVSTDWTIVGLGDFSGDGKADILWQHTSGSVYEWLMDGISIIGSGYPGGV